MSTTAEEYRESDDLFAIGQSYECLWCREGETISAWDEKRLDDPRCYQCSGPLRPSDELPKTPQWLRNWLDRN